MSKVVSEMYTVMHGDRYLYNTGRGLSTALTPRKTMTCKTLDILHKKIDKVDFGFINKNNCKIVKVTVEEIGGI